MQGQRVGIGYMRGSSPDRQLDGAQVGKMFTDKASGKSILHPQLDVLLSYVREGDTLVKGCLARNLDERR